MADNPKPRKIRRLNAQDKAARREVQVTEALTLHKILHDRANVAKADDELAKVHAIELLGSDNEWVFDMTDPDTEQELTVKAVVIRGESLVINYDQLKKKIGAEKYKRCHKPVFDNNLLDQLIKAGEVTFDDVAECSEPKPHSPYVRFYPKAKRGGAVKKKAPAKPKAEPEYGEET